MASGRDPVNRGTTETPQQTDPEKTWADLFEGISQAYTCNRTDMSRSRYMELYRCVCCYTAGPSQSSELANPRTSMRDENPDKSLFLELYSGIGSFLESHLQNLVRKGINLIDEGLLRFYVHTWEEYKISSKLLDGICSFINRTWVKRMNAIGSKEFFEIYDLALILWKRCAFSVLKDKLTKSMLRLIEKDRSGEDVDTKLLSVALSSYVEIGINEENPSARKPSLTTYKTAFEDSFLKATECYYERVIPEYIRRHSVTEYVNQVDICLREEQRRVLLCMHESTLQPLQEVCEKVLVEKRLEIFCDEFQNLLKSNWQGRIGRVSQLVSRTASGIERLRECLEEHVLADGLSTVETLGDKAFQDPILYVDTLLQVHHKYTTLIKAEFDGSAAFINSLDKACEKLVNNNAVTKRVNSSEKSSELLARYCGSLLSKASEHPHVSDIEDALNEVVIVFKYIQDKDVFEKLYSTMLAERLVNQMSVSYEAETSMISKLKQACGMTYTSKLQRMCQDVCLSKDLSKEFRKYMADTGEHIGLQFSVLVLTAGWWPFEESTTCSLPQALCPSVQWFTAFYYNKHSSRKLTWLHNVSRGELAANCFKNAHTFQASMFQIAVLLEFNIALSFTVQQLQESTRIVMDTLLQVLTTLLKCRLLVRAEEAAEDPTSLAALQLEPGTLLSLNEKYNNKKVRVNINVPLKAPAKVEQYTPRKAVQLDRKLCIQAAIVRIMKVRKTLKHQELVTEVLSHLSSRFIPEVFMIKAGIDTMLDKEYIKRAEGQLDVYNYVA